MHVSIEPRVYRFLCSPVLSRSPVIFVHVDIFQKFFLQGFRHRGHFTIILLSENVFILPFFPKLKISWVWESRRTVICSQPSDNIPLSLLEKSVISLTPLSSLCYLSGYF